MSDLTAGSWLDRNLATVRRRDAMNRDKAKEEQARRAREQHRATLDVDQALELPVRDLFFPRRPSLWRRLLALVGL